MPSLKVMPYSEEVRPQDTERALKTLTPALFPNETNPWAVDFEGTCPRCGDPIQTRKWLFTIGGASKLNDKQRKALATSLDELGIDRSSGDESFDLTCSCNVAHPHCPKDKSGCGSRFRVRVTWP